MQTPDFRDTQYWNRMNESERKDYMYLMRKFQQAWDEVEFAMDGHKYGSLSIYDLAVIAARSTNDLMEFERTLLVKYWRTNSPGNDNSNPV